MHRAAAAVLVCVTLGVGPRASAQPTTPASTGHGGRATSAPDAHVSAAGPRARLRRDAEGRTSMIVGASIPPTGAGSAADAVGLLRRFGDVLGVPRGLSFRVEGEQRHHGFHIVRLRRIEGARPVIGGSAVVRSGPDGSVDLIAVTPGPAAVESAAHPLSESQARDAAARLGRGAPVAARAVALALHDAVVPAWQVDVHGRAETERARVVLDARDGSVLSAAPLAIDALGRVFARNPTSDMDATTDVGLTSLGDTDALTGSFFQVANCDTQAGGGCAGSQRARANAEGDFLFEPDRAAFDDAFAEVNAYHHLSVSAEYHRTRHGFEWRCSSQPSMRVFVNYTEAPLTPYDNAAFNPASGGECGFLLFGQGNGSDFAYDADVVAHEFGHAVTDQVSGIVGFVSDALGVNYEPLAVNEGTSDYWAGTLQGDPEIAESFAGLDAFGAHASLRVIDNDLACPSDLFGEGHLDGRLWAGLAWELRAALGPDKTDALLFATVASMTEDPSLSTASALLVGTAMAMVSMGTLEATDLALIEDRAQARGLPGCQRIVPLDDGEAHRGWSGSEFITGNLGRNVTPLHYRIEVPADATALHLRLRRLTPTGTYTMHLRTGGPVRVNVVRIISDAQVPVTTGEVLLDESELSSLPLPRCSTLHVALEATDLRTRGQSLYEISAELERSMDPTATCPAMMAAADGGAPDAGPGGGDAGVVTAPSNPGGCACGVGRASTTGTGAAFASLGLLLTRLRRHRRSSARPR